MGNRPRLKPTRCWGCTVDQPHCLTKEHFFDKHIVPARSAGANTIPFRVFVLGRMRFSAPENFGWVGGTKKYNNNKLFGFSHSFSCRLFHIQKNGHNDE